MGGKKVDITGRIFGELFVERSLGNGLWECVCSCGKHKTYRTYTLTHGDAITCGHGKKMNNGENLSGRTFGNWEVIEYAQNGMWKCKCKCINGTIANVRGADLKSGKSKSCGCLGRTNLYNSTIGDFIVIGYNKSTYKWQCKCKVCGEVVERTKYELVVRNLNRCTKRKRYEDLTGKKFGEWTVLKYLGNYKWQCECSCENHTVQNIDRYSLINGKSTNCGCKRHEDLTGKIFGRLKVIKYLGNMIWQCECSCNEHNVVTVTSGNLISGGTKSCGCLKNESRNSKEEYLKIINDYILNNGDKPYIEDIADIIGIHRENARHNIEKYGIEKYINKSFGSHYEHDLFNFIKQIIPEKEMKLHDRNIISPLEIDIYIPSYKLAIEFNGDYWHSEEKICNRKYHQNKTIACAKKGIQLISIFEYEWKDSQEKIKQFIKNKLDTQKNIIYARNTQVKYIDNYEAKRFLEEYHIQGYIPASINIGLFYNNEMVSLLTFGKPRFNNEYEYEILRYCNKYEYGVIGGIEKLFSHFVSEYKPSSIITYSDISKFTGNVYLKIGFKPISPIAITEPSYIWTDSKGNIILSRYQTQKKNLVEKGWGNEEQTETEIMQSHGFMQVFDCGNIRLEWLGQK